MGNNIDLDKAVVIGGSAGSLNAMIKIIPSLGNKFKYPVFVALHRHKTSRELSECIGRYSFLNVKDAEDKEPVSSGTVYLAPSAYHMMIDYDKTISLSVDAPIAYAIPSIDILFESASDVYGKNLLAVLLTGASSDGTEGMKYIKKNHGICIVQDPKRAEFTQMPMSAVENVNIDFIMNLEEIAGYIRGF